MKSIKTAIILWTLIARLDAAPRPCAQEHVLARENATAKASAIQIEMMQAGEVSLPAEFRVALYENLIQEMQKGSGFPEVYRDGDRNAAGAPDLVILHTTVTGFKQGSELKRDVTTVGGATSITVLCQFTDREGKVLLERSIDGKVRLIGDNLNATDDFAKKTAKLASERFNPDRNAANSASAILR